MTDHPFGFGFGKQPDDDPERGENGRGDAERRGQGPAGSGAGGNDFGFGGGAGGFDLGQLGNMLSQLGRMMSEADTSGGPVNYDIARKLALQALPAEHPASSVDLTRVRDAAQLAELWLDGATAFPVGATTVTAWNSREWVEKTMPAWQELCTPIAARVTGAWTDTLPAEIRGQVGPLLGMLSSMGGMSFGTQLGQGLAQLAAEVLTSTDVGLPLGPQGTAALLPRAIAEFGRDLAVPEDQVLLFLAAREAAHHRLFAGVPWLRARILELVDRYAAGITVDFGEMENLAERFDPSDPAKMQELLSGQGLGGGFEPTVSPGQHAALAELETLLALIEGWVDAVVEDAVGERLPGAAALQETMRRRRASGGPSEQTFATLIGLELRPRRLRAAAELWSRIEQHRGVDARDALWAHVDLLPTAADLDDPEGFLERDRQFTELLAGLDDVTDLGDVSFDDQPPRDEKPTSDPRSGETDGDGPQSDGPDGEGPSGPEGPVRSV